MAILMEWTHQSGQVLGQRARLHCAAQLLNAKGEMVSELP